MCVLCVWGRERERKVERERDRERDREGRREVRGKERNEQVMERKRKRIWSNCNKSNLCFVFQSQIDRYTTMCMTTTPQCTSLTTNLAFHTCHSFLGKCNEHPEDHWLVIAIYPQCSHYQHCEILWTVDTTLKQWTLH